MKLGVYAYKNKMLGAFNAPLFDRDDYENYTTILVRSIKLADKKVKFSMKGLELYKIGTFDDVTGVIVPCMNYLLDVDTILAEVEDDGTEEN